MKTLEKLNKYSMDDDDDDDNAFKKLSFLSQTNPSLNH